MTNDVEELLELENRRCRAIAERDVGALREILMETYIHIHATGKIDDLQGHIDAVLSRPRSPSRGRLTVRRIDNCAVIVGEQLNNGQQSDVLVAHQVAVRDAEGTWRFQSMALVPKRT